MVKIKKNSHILISSLVGLVLLAQSGNIFAATFSLSVRPYEGGYNLNYGKISPISGRVNKEVTVNIISDIAKQYRLVQALLEPLSTVQGSSIARNSFVVYGLRGTNQYGTLIGQDIPVSWGNQIIYTSNQTGASDSFTLVYSFILPQDVEPGSYRGRIGLTLEPIDATLVPVTAFLDVFVEIEVESEIEIRTAAGSKNIMLKPGREDTGQSNVIVNIKGGFGKQFRILQLVSEQPVSSDGNLLDWESVKFTGADAQKGIVINLPTVLSTRQQIIYTSSPRGEADIFAIAYSLGDLTNQKAGTYRSRIKYILEGTGLGETRLIDTLDLEIENPRIFDLTITPELGGTIRFRDLKPSEPPKYQEVIFEAKTNIGKPYQVTQDMKSLLTTKEGIVIPQECFTLREENLETKGTLKYPEEAAVKVGQMVLLISDPEGSPDKFKVIYELTAPRDIHFGDYYTNFTYTVSEI